MKLIQNAIHPRVLVGLGNPGKEYEHTRHNLGFLVLDELAKHWEIKFKKNLRDSGQIAIKFLAGESIYLLKPLTFVNLSGIAVRKLMLKYQIPISELMVICDDFSLPFGKLRLRLKGSSGGHKGLQSIIDNLGSDLFLRLRIGIGYIPAGIDPVDFVLSEFNETEKLKLNKVIEYTVLSIKKIFQLGVAKAMETINRETINESSIS